MAELIRLLFVSGSTRRGSTNTAALRTASEVAPPGVVASLYEGLSELPAFNPDDDHDALPPGVQRLRRELRDADGVLFCSPEYAGTLPGSFKNLLDWTVGGEEMYGKPVAWLNVAAEGRGGGVEQALATVLRYVGAAVLYGACAHLPIPRQAVGPDGTIADVELRGRLAEIVRTVAEQVREHNRSARAEPASEPEAPSPPRARVGGLKVDIVVFEGFDELDALGPLEVLRTGRAMGAELTASLVSVDGAAHVTGAHGLRLMVDGRAQDDADLVIVPGGGWNDRAPAGAWAEAARGVVPDYLARRHQAGATVAGVCTGVMLLATAGLTTGRPAITHHTAAGELETSGASVVRARVVDDGDVLTAGGVTSGLDLALWILERHWGADLARAVATEIEYPRRTDVWPRQP